MAKEIRCKPCGGSSPYFDWIERQGFLHWSSSQQDLHGKHLTSHIREVIAKGEPDTLAAPEEQTKEPLLEAILEVLDDGGEKVLTPKQQKAFQLIVREGVSYRATARKLRISVNAVADLVKAGAKKLRILALTK
jgi:DNA-directed RNA polymerase specialized sigma24 family protein